MGLDKSWDYQHVCIFMTLRVFWFMDMFGAGETDIYIT